MLRVYCDNYHVENCYLQRQRDEAVELVEAFKSYLEDDSRSPRRKQACLNACSAFLERMKEKT